MEFKVNINIIINVGVNYIQLRDLHCRFVVAYHRNLTFKKADPPPVCIGLKMSGKPGETAATLN